MISTAIQQLVNYGLDTGLILPDDEIYIRNQLLMTMQLDDFTAPEGEVCYTDLESILKTLVDDAVARGVCADNSTARDLFDTKLMGVLTPRPSIVRANFEAFLQMVTASGDSSWEYLQNVIPAGYKEHQEVAVTIAAAKHYLGGKGAVRVHGGGFAGTVQAFVPVEMLADFKANMEKILGAGRCHVLSIRPEGGAVL